MIYVFKTSLKSKGQLQKLKPLLDKALPRSKWNVDFEDCDKILRIDSPENIVSAIVNLLKTHNLVCEELQ
ncbi:hypothetical protein LAG90_06025 [Marinilongibacter aquaticus]|uniref:hypothetical protein n=1 Tax=Marinilongibacter aquaticus TaxID=2975157 RepID=UPI0021BDA9FC|nr:hypothetical protein [Marinilongibacter aquaticus]UBM60199.1 hypothetical protein LAG90_06025 [Marinilongibacter aquaticus]